MAALISQLAHVELLTPNLEASTRFFSDFVGLQASAEGSAPLTFRAWGESFRHSLQLTASDEPGLGHVAWRTTSERALETAATAIEQSGHGLLDR